jgi:GT2 family glycosyltransferase
MVSMTVTESHAPLAGIAQSPLQRAARLVAVVVTFNRLDQIKLTLDRLLACRPELLAKIVVVDNASSDGTSAWLDGLSDPRIDTVHLAQNIGGAGGFDAGMRRAVDAHDADWIVVMDDDARPFAGAIERFMFTEPAADCVAAAVLYPDRGICEMNRPSVNPFTNPQAFFKTLMGRGRDGYHIARANYFTQVPVPIDLTSFVGFFVPRKCIEAIGYPDPNLFIYGDDVLYTLSLRRAGFSIAFDPRITFEHDCKTFDDDAVRHFTPLWKAYFAYRNGLFMYRQAAGPVLFWPIFVLCAAKWMLATVRYSGNKRPYLRVLCAALWDAVRQDTRRCFTDVKRLSGDV